MIIVKLMGGLGNQMFQYAFGRRLSLLRNTKLKLDLSFLQEKAINHTQRQYELEVFNLGNCVATQEQLDRFKQVERSKIRKAVHSILPFLPLYSSTSEATHSFDSRMLQLPANSWASGYWQSEKYFHDIADTIRKDFSFKSLSGEANIKYAAQIIASNSVSLHVRRGDYVSNPETNKVHGVCGEEYYLKAIDYVKSQVPDCKLFVFSDDIDWVKQNIRTDLPTTYIEGNIGDEIHVDMQLMSLCRHNIIANSSFSWWAAWLNGNRNKIVIAPNKWFNDASIDSKDIIPENWIKL